MTSCSRDSCRESARSSAILDGRVGWCSRDREMCAAHVPPGVNRCDHQLERARFFARGIEQADSRSTDDVSNLCHRRIDRV